MLPLKKLAHAVFDPIIEEIPLFIITFLLSAYQQIQLLHGCIVAHYELPTWINALRGICFAALFSYVYTQLCNRFHNKTIRILCYGFPIMLFIVNLFTRLNFGSNLNPSYILMIGETNTKETSEFLSTFLFCTNGMKVIAALVGLIALSSFAERFKEHIVKYLRKRYVKIPVCLFVTICLVGNIYNVPFYYSLLKMNSFKQLDRWASSNECQFLEVSVFDSYTNLIYSLGAPRIAKKEMQNSILRTLEANDFYTMENDSVNVVLVIGESYIKAHSPLYGYYLNTTPLTKGEYQRDNLFVFNHINTPYNATSATLRNLFSCNCLGFGEDWGDNVFMPILFRRSGYDVYFWDNQNMVQVNTWDFTLNSYLHNDKLALASYTAENKQPYQYDGDLINDFFKQRFSLNKNNLTIIHLWGQHLKAKQRYPNTAKTNRFTADSVKLKHSWLTKEMRNEIAQYDNATYYNDMCMGKIFDHYRDANAVIVYLSDHGEEIYDWRPSMGRKADPMSKNVVKCQFEIPFMVWCSDKYKAKYTERVKAIRAALNKPMPSDITCNMVFHLAGMKTKYYRPSLDILNTAYKCPKRIINDKWDITKVE